MTETTSTAALPARFCALLGRFQEDGELNSLRLSELAGQTHLLNGEEVWPEEVLEQWVNLLCWLVKHEAFNRWSTVGGNKRRTHMYAFLSNDTLRSALTSEGRRAVLQAYVEELVVAISEAPQRTEIVDDTALVFVLEMLEGVSFDAGELGYFWRVISHSHSVAYLDMKVASQEQCPPVVAARLLHQQRQVSEFVQFRVVRQGVSLYPELAGLPDDLVLDLLGLMPVPDAWTARALPFTPRVDAPGESQG